VTGEHYTLGWLPAVIPLGARRFRVADPTLAAVLAEAGGELVETGADVEIARSPAELEGTARLAVVSVSPQSGHRGSRVGHAAVKAGAAARAVVLARRARSALGHLGYPEVSVLRWDVRHRAALDGFPAPPRSVPQRLAGGALVVARRGPHAPTALEASLEAAGRAVGAALRPHWASIRPGPVLAATDRGVLRVAIGPSRVELDSQAAALAALAAAEAPPLVAERIPWLLAAGEAGLARWSLERLRPGMRPTPALSPALVNECVDFLVALHGVSGEATSLTGPAETVGAVCSAESATRLRALVERLDGDLAGVPRGFGHGDFFPGNLLVTGDRLTGVLDWDAGGPGRLPLLDLLHLELTRSPYGGDDRWGRAVLERLLPSARAGGEATLRRYCVGIGLDPDPAVLEALVLAYWLEYAAYQLRTHPDRHSQPAWIEGNLELVLREAGTAPRRTARGRARGALTREA
jgi:aminoglycoside phosphotransferase (APT) family kinase protein